MVLRGEEWLNIVFVEGSAIVVVDVLFLDLDEILEICQLPRPCVYFVSLVCAMGTLGFGRTGQYFSWRPVQRQLGGGRG